MSGAGRPGRVMRATTSEGTGFGIKYPASGSLDLPYQGVSVWIKATSTFYFFVRVHATNGSDYYLQYVPSTWSPYPSGSYAIIRVGSQYKDGTWRELNRDLDADLQSVFGVGVEYVKWFCIRGDYDLDDLRLYDGEVETSYYYFGGQRVAMRKNDVVQYIVGDHLGTTSVVLNADGTLASEARHYPYGQERWSSGTLPTDRRFTGQKLIDSAGGIYHMGARFYDPYINRFVSPDSIVPQPGNPQSLNRFSYALGNPLKYVDPSGHKVEGACPTDDPACEDTQPIDETIDKLLQSIEDIVYDPERTTPIVLEFGPGQFLVVMPVGSDSYQQRDGPLEDLKGWSWLPGGTGLFLDCVEAFGLVAGGGVGITDVSANADFVVAGIGSAMTGDMWINGKPHPDLPSMWLAGQDVLVTGGDATLPLLLGGGMGTYSRGMLRLEWRSRPGRRVSMYHGAFHLLRLQQAHRPDANTHQRGFIHPTRMAGFLCTSLSIVTQQLAGTITTSLATIAFSRSEKIADPTIAISFEWC